MAMGSQSSLALSEDGGINAAKNMVIGNVDNGDSSGTTPAHVGPAARKAADADPLSVRLQQLLVKSQRLVRFLKL